MKPCDSVGDTMECSNIMFCKWYWIEINLQLAFILDCSWVVPDHRIFVLATCTIYLFEEYSIEHLTIPSPFYLIPYCEQNIWVLKSFYIGTSLFWFATVNTIIVFPFSVANWTTSLLFVLVSVLMKCQPENAPAKWISI